MTEVWFYHLVGTRLETVLPNLLEKSLERGWKAVVQAVSEPRLRALDEALWTHADDSFLPHATDVEGDAASQSVLLTLSHGNANGAQVRFFVEGADPLAALGVSPAYERCIVLFDGDDPTGLATARTQWSALKGAGHAVTYWQQTPSGRWEKKA